MGASVDIVSNFEYCTLTLFTATGNVILKFSTSTKKERKLFEEFVFWVSQNK